LVITRGVRIAVVRAIGAFVDIDASSALILLVARFAVTGKRARGIGAILRGAITVICARRAFVDVCTRRTRTRETRLAGAGKAWSLVGTRGVCIAVVCTRAAFVDIDAGAALVRLIAGLTFTGKRARGISAILRGAITVICARGALVDICTRRTRARETRLAGAGKAWSLVGTSGVCIAPSRSIGALVDIDASAVLVLLVAGFTFTSKTAGAVHAVSKLGRIGAIVSAAAATGVRPSGAFIYIRASGGARGIALIPGFTSTIGGRAVIGHLARGIGATQIVTLSISAIQDAVHTVAGVALYTIGADRLAARTVDMAPGVCAALGRIR
jgi:hypothetical protein